MTVPWSPACGLDAIARRAELLARARAFFAERGVLEVITPVLGHSGPPDPHVSLVEARFPGSDRRFWLQPSPESAMKRLLAAGSGPIYQIGPAFRAWEEGARHNPEFQMLEWYRPGFDLEALAEETDALLRVLLDTAPARRLDWCDVFAEHVGLNPFEASDADLRRAAATVDEAAASVLGRDGWLDLLFSHRVEPHLGPGAVQVFDFPASQAAMAVVEGRVARRMEVYVDGLELANGYLELTDAAEQGARFEASLELRRQRGAPTPPLDQPLLDALAHGFPASAGIALGFDRLVMLSLGRERLTDVMAFPLGRA